MGDKLVTIRDKAAGVAVRKHEATGSPLPLDQYIQEFLGGFSFVIPIGFIPATTQVPTEDTLAAHRLGRRIATAWKSV